MDINLLYVKSAQNKNKKKGLEMDKNFSKITINSVTVVLLAVLFIGYKVWDKYSTQAVIEREAAATEEMRKQKATQYKKCVSIAYDNYDGNWADACRTLAKNTSVIGSQAKLKACKQASLDSAYFNASPSVSWQTLQRLGDAQCESKYSEKISVFVKDCTLPVNQANYVNSKLKEERDYCLTLSKL